MPNKLGWYLNKHSVSNMLKGFTGRRREEKTNKKLSVMKFFSCMLSWCWTRMLEWNFFFRLLLYFGAEKKYFCWTSAKINFSQVQWNLKVCSGVNVDLLMESFNFFFCFLKLTTFASSDISIPFQQQSSS